MSKLKTVLVSMKSEKLKPEQRWKSAAVAIHVTRTTDEEMIVVLQLGHFKRKFKVQEIITEIVK